jgi:hypothetical protein
MSYLELGSLDPLMADLRRQGIVTKLRTLKTGKIVGGIPFTRGGSKKPANGDHFHTRREFSSCARMRGGAGRTRTNHQSVMECGRVRPAHLVGHEALELEEARY